ncbi:MAG: hypothetical protein KIH08_06125 [Candidatus Freyarchaeota archaeon]|nr:hypothetical protein [Candidatus Jordarchaeia archaeon]MBS7268756.1 hypothetical protein [Candidatus Jordarchaeia archaeon]MBS7279585.1 hypothetical protein [Candidatus Jordarchaeia archaeon]
MSEEQGKEKSEPPRLAGFIIALFGLPTAIAWILWTNFYIHYLEGYTINMTLFAAFLPYMLPYLNTSLFVTLFVLFQLILYMSSREFMILLWYSGLVAAAIIFLVADIIQVPLGNETGHKIISKAFAGIGIILTILMFLGPQIAFHTFIARIPLYIATAIIIRG